MSFSGSNVETKCVGEESGEVRKNSLKESMMSVLQLVDQCTEIMREMNREMRVRVEQECLEQEKRKRIEHEKQERETMEYEWELQKAEFVRIHEQERLEREREEEEDRKICDFNTRWVQVVKREREDVFVRAEREHDAKVHATKVR